MNFKDHFSRQAKAYAEFRPQYPKELFAFIAANAPNDKRAIDLATGNGQAALALAQYFQEVIALDASAAQIASAQPHDCVEYRVAPAEATGLPAKSVSAITVAQALHWFDLAAFYQEARRILVSGGLIAFWAYNYLRISPPIDDLVRRYHDEIIGPYWPPERKLVGRPYLDFPFPFEEIAVPPFQIEVRWSLAQLLGYLRTWSSTQRYLAAKGSDPVELIEPELVAAWEDSAEQKLAVWPLTVRAGRA